MTPRLLCLLLLLALRPLAAQPGRLVIVGGALRDTNTAVYRAILDARQGSGPFCIIPTAGATPESAMDGPVRTFERYSGAGTARGVLISAKQPETARDPAVVAQLEACSGFYFIGGVQSRVTAAFRPDGQSTPAYEAVLKRWRVGAVVAGSSAGAAIMSDPMIANGTSAGAFSRGLVRREGAAADDDSTAGMVMSHGLGFFPAALADQHFLARGRFGRLLVALLDVPGFDLAFGIDENTALVVDGLQVRAVGASAVAVFDARDAVRAGRSARGVTMHLMGSGDAFDLKSRRYTASAEKTALDAGGPAVVSPANIFAPWEFLRTLDAFGRSTDRELSWPVSGGAITLRKADAFRATRLDGTGVQNVVAGLGMTGLRMDVERPATAGRAP
ncbi:cyanophycinase [Gemmatimonas sp.]|uniref:cyanophycinase n=2 Tax=Gemmatimonas sp. TaxID=1962908 RepID=UPI003569DEEB